jgi:hypothetical protein
MGETCSTCQDKNISTEEIKSIEEPAKSAAKAKVAAVPIEVPETPAPMNSKECDETNKEEKKK